MTTDSTTKGRKQAAWLVIAAALVALGGMLVPAIRDLFPFVAAATVVVMALLLVVFAPVVALRRDGAVPFGFLAMAGVLLGPCLAMLVMTDGPLFPVAVAWVITVGGLVVAGALRSALPLRRVSAPE